MKTRGTEDTRKGGRFRGGVPVGQPGPPVPDRRTLDDTVGNTPMVELRRLAEPGSAPVRVKLEGRNPGGSVKDRAALAILREAEREGRMGPDTTLLDASSGNTGIAYAMLCAARGYRCEICLPATASRERKQLLARYGASVVITDPAQGSDGAIREARRRARAEPDRYYYADQYNNPANLRAHYEGTGPEIWLQTGGRVTHLVLGLGTSGTFVGAGTRLLELYPGIRLIAVQPDSPFHGIEGLKHMESALVPGIYRPELAHRTVRIRTEAAQEGARRLAREEGLLTGSSGGANVAAALEVAREAGPDALVVTLLPDGGERYLNDEWWEEEG